MCFVQVHCVCVCVCVCLSLSSLSLSLSLYYIYYKHTHTHTEREAATRARTTAIAEQSEVVLRAELLEKEVGDKQSKLLHADRALNKAAEKAMALERDLSRASEAHQVLYTLATH